MINNNLFSKTNSIGKKGEEAVKAYYTAKGCQVIDVSNNKEYQKADIDLIINGQTVEVKTATKLPDYKQFCVELVSNDAIGYYKDGWFNTSQANFVIFVSPKEGKFYEMNLDELRQMYDKNKDKYEKKRVVFREFGDVYKPSVLAFIPIEDVEAQLTIYRKVSIYDDNN